MSGGFHSELPTDKLEQLNSFIDAGRADRDSLIAVLHRAQEIFGYLPRELQLHIARKLGIPASRVNGVVSFYSYFSQEKRGKHTISVCMGTACFVKGAEGVLKEMENQLNTRCGRMSEDGEFTLRDVRCVGACGLAPVVMIDDRVHGHVKKEDVASLIAECRSAGEV